MTELIDAYGLNVVQAYMQHIQVQLHVLSLSRLYSLDIGTVFVISVGECRSCCEGNAERNWRKDQGTDYTPKLIFSDLESWNATTNDSKFIPKTFMDLYSIIWLVYAHSTYMCLAGVGGDRANCPTGRG